MAASRAVFLGLLLLFPLYLIFVKKHIGTLSIVWIILFIFSLSIQELRESENPRINEVANSVEALTLFLSGEIDVGGSIEWRRELVENGLNAFFSSYGLGLGAGGSVANQEIMGPVAGRFTSMHNFWLELVVDAGILFACIFFLWYVSISWTLFKIGIQSKVSDLKYLGKSLSLSMIIFVPAAISSSSVIYFFPMWLMYGFAIATIEADSKAKDQGPSLSSLQYLSKKNF